MSSFIVDPDTINRIVTYIDNYDSGRTGREEPAISAILGMLAVPRPEGVTQMDRLCQTMTAVNHEAYYVRYRDSDVAPLRTPDSHVALKFLRREVSGAQVVKAIQCWIYQCSEGDVAEHPLVLAFGTLADAICVRAMSETPEYSAARWG